MIIQYNIVVTIVNLIDNSTSRFDKVFDAEVTATTDALLYNNYHVLSKGVYILDMFQDEVDAYCKALGIEKSSVEIDEFEIVSLTDRVDVFFESEDDSNQLSLKPIIKCYVYPKNEALKVPELMGAAYDSTTIIWTWPNDEMYAHYLVEEAIDPNSEADQSKIIAQLPIGATSYVETGLTPDTPYTRRLINYTDEQTSATSPSVTVMTETVEISQSLEEYVIPKNYDFTTDDSQREIIEENLEAFHSGIGDGNDLKLYKQMDADFYQKFKAYFELSGRRIQREKRYDQVGFHYKICLEAIETIEEQEGEVTFDLTVYPREEVTLQQYMYATKPATVYAKLMADIFLRKEVDEDETVEIELKEPDWSEGEPIYEIDWQNSALIISLDCSNSQRFTPRSGEDIATYSAQTLDKYNTLDGIRCTKMVQAVTTTIAAFENTVTQQTGQSGLLEYVLVLWAKEAFYIKKYAPGSAIDLINDVSTLKITRDACYLNGTAIADKNMICGTNFYDGLVGGTQFFGNLTGMESTSKPVIGTLFFSDGFCNYYKVRHNHTNGDLSYTAGQVYKACRRNGLNNNQENSNQHCNAIMNSMNQGFIDAGHKVCVILGCTVDEVDHDYSMTYKNAIKAFNGEIWNTLCNNSSPNKYKVIQISMDYSTATQIANEMIDSTGMFSEVITGYGPPVFKGWKDSGETTEVVNYTIDDVKIVHVESELLPFTFDTSKTPVTYDPKQKRAVIRLQDFLEKTKLADKSVYDIILEAAQKTPEWQNGYNKTIGTKDGSYLIRGLFIQDTYAYGMEDTIDDATFDASELEDGMVGSVNVYTDINKAGTTTFGDDCYLVTKNNYPYIHGFTEAIIYDGQRFITAELNALNRPEVVILSPDEDYRSLLHNRKNEDIQYDGDKNKITSIIEIIEKGKDITIEGCPELKEVGDIATINEITEEVVAKIDAVFKSPILNYRFNLEDPESKTPYCEILPDCDPFSNYYNIVELRVYYARNVYITDKNYYVEAFGEDPVATENSAHLPLVEDKTQWQERLIDEYLWFYAKPMQKTQDYYDELPGPGMDTMYGMVNNRYNTDGDDRRKLRVDTPQFNIPTTVHMDSVRIYIVITEFYPANALVSYKWEHPWNEKDAITQVNGDYVTFNSDSITFEDVEYLDVISTINMENQEVFDNKTTEKIYEITKPDTIHEYKNYYLAVTTDNGDVLALRYPTEITFDENGLASVGVAFKGVINATSQWAPRVHNGYYYLNQHEYFAYSEFDVEANFDTVEDVDFKTAIGYLTVAVQLRHKAKPAEEYLIVKNTRSELLQDEEAFQWINEKGLTLRPYIDGEYYREYLTTMYESPLIMFPNILTEAGVLTVDYTIEDGSEELTMEVRSYDVETGLWSEWVRFDNGTIPTVPLSSAYQVRFPLQVSAQNFDVNLEDYMCCYLDWKEDMNEANTVNIVTVTDHMEAGPDKGDGTYVSKVLDYGCETELQLDLFDSQYVSEAQLFIAYSDNPDMLLLENIKWTNITKSKDAVFKARYFRYQIIVPYGERVYWLHKRVKTKETHEILPFVTGISMAGTFAPSDIVTNFINTESFEIPMDGQSHVIFDKLSDIIAADIIEKGYTTYEAEFVTIQCITDDIHITYDKNLEGQYPYAYFNTPIEASTSVDYDVIVKNTPYIFVEKDDYDNDVIKIIGTPQQYCPITVEDINGQSYLQLHNTTSFIQGECYELTEDTKYIELKTNRYDPGNFKVFIDDDELDIAYYKVVNHLVIFNDFIKAGHKITVEYCILYSFIAVVDRVEGTTVIHLHTGEGIDMPEKAKVFFETSTKNNKFVAKDLSLNPIYRTDYKGFIYLTDEHNEPYSIKIYCNPLRLKAGGYDKVDISIEVLDIEGNPIIAKDVAVDCNYGILNCEDYVTDMNGVIHLVYESAYLSCKDKLSARVLKDDGSVVESSIIIINE